MGCHAMNDKTCTNNGNAWPAVISSYESVQVDVCAYPNADEVVQYLLEREEAGLHHNSEEVYEVVGYVPDWRETTKEESPSPKLEMYNFLHCHSNIKSVWSQLNQHLTQ